MEMEDRSYRSRLRDSRANSVIFLLALSIDRDYASTSQFQEQIS